MLKVDKEHLDCEMSEECLEKLLDIDKYQDTLWLKEEETMAQNITKI